MPKISKQGGTTKKSAKKKAPAKSAGSTGTILDRAKPAELPRGIKLNLYGASGTGKTTVWSTFPKPIYCILISGGGEPGELRSIDEETRSQIKVYHPEHVYDLIEIAEAMRANEGMYPTVVVDHLTALQDMAVCEVGNFSEAPAQGSWGLLEQQQWGQVASQVKESLRPLLSLPCNVVLVAQERYFNTDSKDPRIKPYVASALTPSTVGWVNPAVDYICQTFIRDVPMEVDEDDEDDEPSLVVPDLEYCLRVAPHTLYASKFRKPKGGQERPEYIVDPDYDKIVQLING
jgi:hypothetical protein